MRVVFDTNVLASGILGIGNRQSLPGRLLRAWSGGQFELIVSQHILAELRQTFSKPYFLRRLTQQQVGSGVDALRRQATPVDVTVEVYGVATHPEDEMILAAAVSAQADYLVTGDHQLQQVGTYEGVTILSPRQFLDVLTSLP